MFRELQAELNSDVDVVHTSLTELSRGSAHDMHRSILRVQWEVQHPPMRRGRTFNGSSTEQITHRPPTHELTLYHEDGHECTIFIGRDDSGPFVAGLGDVVLVVEAE